MRLLHAVDTDRITDKVSNTYEGEMISLRVISRFDTEVREDAFTRVTERCPKCNLMGQNFIGFSGGPELLLNILVCRKCGTMFMSKEFLDGLDFQAIQEACERPFKCGKCGRGFTVKAAKINHEKACKKDVSDAA